MVSSSRTGGGFMGGTDQVVRPSVAVAVTAARRDRARD